jgi:hypothetical protein
VVRALGQVILICVFLTSPIASRAAEEAAVKMEFFVSGAEREDVCRPLLTQGNVVWQGPSEQQFSVTIPAKYQQPDWRPVAGGDWFRVDEARFDLANSGRQAPVFRVMRRTRTFQYDWYIVPATDEVDTLRTRLDAIASNGMATVDDDVFALAGELSHPSAGQAGPFPTANVSSFRSSGSLKSRLYDTSNAPAYAGWYTESYAFSYSGRSYLVALSVNNLGGPTAAIFRPAPDGSLELVCARHVPNARSEWRVTRDSDDACPAVGGGRIVVPEERDIQWTEMPGLSPSIHRWFTTIDTPAGPRTFVKTELPWGRYYVVNRLAIQEGGPPPTLSPYAAPEDSTLHPFADHDDDSSVLVLTDRGLYVGHYNFVPERRSDSPPLGAWFERVTATGTQRVCTFEEVFIPPPDDD